MPTHTHTHCRLMAEWQCYVNTSEHINNLYPIHRPNTSPEAQINTNCLLWDDSDGGSGGLPACQVMSCVTRPAMSYELISCTM